MKDFYEILGVSKTSSDQEIKTAYRKLALKWHPDRNKTSEAAARFKEINKAYEVLADSKKRQMYDQVGPEAFERGGAGAPGGGYSQQQGPFSYTYSSGGASPFENINVDFGGFSDPFEIFEQFFGFQSPFGQQQQRRRSIHSITIDFMDAVNGVEKEIKIDGKTTKVKIPAGVDNDNRIRFENFDLAIRIRPHSEFRRQGQDVYIEKEISYTMAVLGGVIEVPTLKKPLKLKIRPGTKSGSLIRLNGEGILHPHSTRRGDMYVMVNIHVPAKASGRAKKLLEELRTEL